MTITLDRQVAEQARRLNIDISAAARSGVRAAVRDAMIRSDREAYGCSPEQADPFWDEAERWGDG